MPNYQTKKRNNTVISLDVRNHLRNLVSITDRKNSPQTRIRKKNLQPIIMDINERATSNMLVNGERLNSFPVRLEKR